MEADLTEAMEQHAEKAREQVRKAAEDMAARTRAITSPGYGVVVESSITPITDGSRVVTEVRQIPGVLGTVYGGVRAAQAEVVKVTDQVAQEASLDRRG